MIYEDLVKIDVLRPILSGFAEKRFRMLRNGKVGWMSRAYIEPNTPWLYSIIDQQRKCYKWLWVYHEYYKIIPRACRNCWKVAYRPKHLAELMKIYKLQGEMDKPSKCGIETRPLTGNKGGYGTFWYSPLGGGLKSARGLRKLVKARLSSCLNRDVPDITIKRGCTEMEQHTVKAGIGGSQMWDNGAEIYDLTEDLLDETFIDVRIKEDIEPPIMRIHTQRVWIEWAYEHNDPTLGQFADKGSFPLPPVNYKDSKVFDDKNFRSTM